MGNWGGEFPGGPEQPFGRILNRDLFHFVLDIEVKRSRRYQNFLCLMLFKMSQPSEEGDRGRMQDCYRKLGNLLIEETRESDIIGSLELDQFVVLLPYADTKAGAYVKSRFEDALKYYDFKGKGIEIAIDQVCFPVNGSDTTGLIQRALRTEKPESK